MHASGIRFDLHHRIPFTLTITSHSALQPAVFNSKQVFRGQIIPLGVAFNNVSLFDACSLFSQEEGKNDKLSTNHENGRSLEALQNPP